MHSDLPHWWAFVQRMKGASEQLVDKSDKEAVWGAESVREGNEEGG